jgi:hypothetical protein
MRKKIGMGFHFEEYWGFIGRIAADKRVQTEMWETTYVGINRDYVSMEPNNRRNCGNCTTTLYVTLL